jgi:hypothetical protein
LSIEVINEEQIRIWRGAINFVHRVKIEVIKDCLRKYPGKIIYTDTDTYCLSSIDTIYKSISPSHVYFHEDEGVINEPTSLHLKKWKKFLSGKTFDFLEGIQPLQVHMWNAGVIGVEDAHLPLLDKVLEITDKLYPSFAKHTIEQFAFSYVFQSKKLQIFAAANFIFHYWNLKEFRDLLEVFFSNYPATDIDTLVKVSGSILPEQMVKDKLAFKRSGAITKLLKRISGKGWSIQNYTTLPNGLG